MDTGITIAVILAMTALGVVLIHRLNAQRDERIAEHHYSPRLPVLREAGPTRPPADGPAQPAAGAHGAHVDEGQGRLRPRRRTGSTKKGPRT